MFRRRLALGGGVVGKIAEQLSLERARQMAYTRLPIMDFARNLSIVIEPVLVDDVEVWPGKIIESVDLVRDDVKLLHYHDIEKVQQAENYIFSEAIVLGIEDLVDPLMYDNFTDIILRMGKMTYVKDIDTHKIDDQFVFLTILNIADRKMTVSYGEEIVYDSETVPVKWKHTIWELVQLVPEPTE